MRSLILFATSVFVPSSLQQSTMQVAAFQTASRRTLRAFLPRSIASSNSLFESSGSVPTHQSYHTTQSSLFAFDKDDGSTNNKKKISKPKKQKIILADPKNVNLDALTTAFDKMARDEGFDDSTAFYAKDSTFENEFDDDLEGDEDDDDDIDFGGDEQSMEERIANAQKNDMDLARVNVSNQLDVFSKEVSKEDLKGLGFRKEANPYGNDETPRREQFQLITDAMKCSACGSGFQNQNEMKPGYLPPPKFEIQIKLQKIEDAQALQKKAESSEWSPEDEVEWLLQSGAASTAEDDDEINIDLMAENLGLDLMELAEKKVICKRCHGLQNFGEAPESLRAGWSEEPALSQEKFRDLLLPLREKPAVIIAVVDLFDFSGSILPELDAIAGDNPVIVAANKADLLPSNMGQTRAESWVRRELEYLGVRSIANIGGVVRLVSCQTGFGVSQLLSKARAIAYDMECDIYVVGAANAGKSTLLNHILEKSKERSKEPRGKKRAGNANKNKGAITASPLPGTTLEFIKIDMGDDLSLYDTPGLLVPGTLTQRLTPAELKMVVPKK